MQKGKVRTVTLTFDQVTWFLHGTCHLVIIIICAILFSTPMMQDEVMSQTLFWNTRTNTHAHTGKTLYALPPFHGGDVRKRQCQANTWWEGGGW